LPPVTTIAESVPEALGAILSSEPVDIGELGVAWRITYRSRSISGEPIEVTGVIAAPAGEATAPRPVLSVAHGTTGMADQCAPSLGFPDNFINSGLAGILERGWVVTATDYEGMGGSGIHPYVVGESEARGVFDIVRAAQTMPMLGANGPLIVWGHSQGGHAAMHAAERWLALAPELDLVGVAAGAPPSQFNLLSAFLKGSDYQGYLIMAAAAMAATYPELDLSTVVRPEHLGLISELENGCLGHIFEVFNEIAYSDLVGVEDIFSIPEWEARLNENDTNQLPNQVPVIILHGEVDSQIPVVSSALLLGQLCAFTDHAPLERRVYEGKGHGTVIPAYWDDLFTWMDARFAGEPAIDQCG
jgi:pimeloyl-ACP methyl ester carboxylesterase